MYRALPELARVMLVIVEHEKQYRVLRISRLIVKQVLSGRDRETHLHAISLDEAVYHWLWHSK